MQSRTKRLIVWSSVATLIVLLLVAMPFTRDEVQWNEAIAYCVILLAIGGVYELWRWLKTHNSSYRVAFGVGLAGALLLGWANGAVGLIGNEDNPANLLYGAVAAVGFFGSLLARFQPRGMARTLFTAAVVQLLVPVFALFIWPAQTAWGKPGVLGVIVLNSFFAIFFLVSALLFQRVANTSKQQAG